METPTLQANGGGGKGASAIGRSMAERSDKSETFPSFDEARDDDVQNAPRRGEEDAVRLTFGSPLEAAMSPIITQSGGRCEDGEPSPRMFASPNPYVLGNEMSRVDISGDDSSSRNGGNEGETDEDRRLREEDESEALARQLMAEEAMASYNISSDFLRNNATQYSEEDLAAVEAALAEEDPMAPVEEVEDEDLDGADQPSEELSYDTLLRIGELGGDVKQERWTMQAKKHIDSLPTTQFASATANGKDENDSAVKCLVCQCVYEEGDTLRRLPCHHCFHKGCIDPWLSSKDVCPYCRQTIVKET